jgi:UDPglucose 6-dehydrogenase
MKVCIVGTGYVGLVTGVCLSHIGHDVVCIDTDKNKIASMQSGKSPIYEPGLAEMMQSSMSANRLRFSMNLSEGVTHGDVIFIAVGTPPLPDGKTDVSYVEMVASGIGAALTAEYKVIVNKSTVPIGSAGWVKMLIEGSLSAQGTSVLVDFDVISNPEFLREGSAIYDTFNPDRIVLGSDKPRAIKLMKQLYQPIIDKKFADDSGSEAVPVVVTDVTSGEMIKYAANSFLITKVSFINEIANICDLVGADISQVAHGIGLDSRIGHKFLKAGIGWGGSCFPKDMSALIHVASEYQYEANLLKAAIKVNEYQRLRVINKLQQELKILKGKTIGLLGLTFKPNTDDLRDAPSLDIIAALRCLGAQVKGYDPMYNLIGEDPRLGEICVVQSVKELVTGCHALVLVTDWDEFLEVDYLAVSKLVLNPLFIDGRNFLSREKMLGLGFNYVGIGR